MSQTIEFDRIAVEYKAPFIDEQDRYLLLHKLGNSRSFNHDDTIAKDWRLNTLGTESEVIADLALAAGDIERGMFRYRNGSTKTENYLRNWRDTINDALTLSEFSDRYRSVDLVITGNKIPNNLQQTEVETIREVLQHWEQEEVKAGTGPQFRGVISQDHLEVADIMSDANYVGIEGMV